MQKHGFFIKHNLHTHAQTVLGASVQFSQHKWIEDVGSEFDVCTEEVSNEMNKRS